MVGRACVEGVSPSGRGQDARDTIGFVSHDRPGGKRCPGKRRRPDHAGGFKATESMAASHLTDMGHGQSHGPHLEQVLLACHDSLFSCSNTVQTTIFCVKRNPHNTHGPGFHLGGLVGCNDGSIDHRRAAGNVSGDWLIAVW